MSDDVRCVHEILHEASSFTRTEDAESLPRLDETASAIRDFLVQLHVEGDDPQILEAMAAGIHIGCIRFAGYLQRGHISSDANDAALLILGELVQAIALMYDQPFTPSAAVLNAAFVTDIAPATP